MQVFKVFYKILKKEVPSLIIYTFIFIVLLFLLTKSATDNPISEYELDSIPIAIFDEDNSILSNALYNYLDSTQKILPIKNQKDSILDSFYYKEIEYLLTIEEGFEKTLLSCSNFDAVSTLLTDNKTLLTSKKLPNTTSSRYLDAYINDYLSTFLVLFYCGYEIEEAITVTNETLSLDNPLEFYYGDKKSISKSNTSYYFLYLPYIFVCILFCSLGLVLVSFRKKDLNQRMLCSSLTITSKNIQLTLASVSYSIIVWIIFMILALISSNQNIFSINGLLFALNSFVFLLFTIGLTYFLSFLAKSNDAFNMLANIIGLGLCFLGGIFVPYEFLGSNIQKISKFLPSYWYMEANKLAEDFTGSTQQLEQYSSCVGVTFLFSVSIFLVALATSKLKTRS